MLFTRYHNKSSASLVVFLHGFMGSYQDFSEVSEHLGKSYSTLLIDLPGHGHSRTHPFNSLEDFFDLLHQTLAPYKNMPIHWVGYSLGGRLIPYLSSHYQTSSACFISSKVLELNKEEQKSRQEFEKRILEDFRKETFGNFLIKWYDQPLFKTLKNNPKLYQSVLLRRECESYKMMQKVFRLTSPLAFESQAQPKDFGSFPKLYCAAREDTKYFLEALNLQQDPRGFYVHLFEEASHSIHLEQPAAFAGVYSHFLEEQR